MVEDLDQVQDKVQDKVMVKVQVQALVNLGKGKAHRDQAKVGKKKGKFHDVQAQGGEYLRNTQIEHRERRKRQSLQKSSTTWGSDWANTTMNTFSDRAKQAEIFHSEDRNSEVYKEVICELWG